MTTSADFEWKVEFEEFHFAMSCFDVAKAKELIRSKRARKVGMMDISGVVDLVGSPPKDGVHTLTALGVGVDWEKVATDEVDMDFPVILVPWRDSHLPIDGWHRIAKGKVTGRETLPYVILTKAEAKMILSAD